MTMLEQLVVRADSGGQRRMMLGGPVTDVS
jgi:hypothetical protein